MLSISSFILPVRHAISLALHAYADWRIGATEAEKRCHKLSDSILLTFDDYGSAEEVEVTLEILRDKAVRAMFFPVGAWAAKNPELVKLLRDGGHIVGNHTATHAILANLSDDTVEREIAGGISAEWLRPPQGRYNARIRIIATRLGYAICYWSIDSRDWTGASVAEMKHTVFNELRPGATILFHINGRHTRAALPEIIDGIRARGFKLTDMAEPDWQPSLPTN